MQSIKTQRNKHADIRERLTVTPRESVKITGIGINNTYTLLRSGLMPSIRAGKKFLIPRAALLRWLQNAGRLDA
jgi:excisionase family DNA binding protein